MSARFPEHSLTGIFAASLPHLYRIFLMESNMKRFFIIVAALAIATPALAQKTSEDQREKNRAENKERSHNIGLTAKVKSALASDAGLRTLTDVSVDVEGDVVTLKGTVDTADQKARVAEAAKKVEGVKQVKNELKVKGG